ncbi:MAG TPA: N-acetyltransferase [Longimicrobiaceae bacterium]|nr:N-acetyltransferase [Longimicrobiaceae bacterium]
MIQLPVFEAPRAIVQTGRVRIRRARIGDMSAVEPIINHFAGRGLMLPRSQEQLTRLFREFTVAVDEANNILGCGALRVYSPTLAEITSLAVEEGVSGQGIGRRIVDRLIEEGRSLKLQTLFALTLREGFFHKLGFSSVDRATFPLKIWADCRSCPKLHACDEIAVAIDITQLPERIR